MAVKVFSVASLSRAAGLPALSSREVSPGNQAVPAPFGVCICSQTGRSRPTVPGSPQQAQPCTWPRCVLPSMDTSSSGANSYQHGGGRARTAYNNAATRLEVVSEQPQLQQTSMHREQPLQNGAEQQQGASLQSLQQRAVQQHQHPQQQQSSLHQPQPSTCKLMQAIQAACGYDQLAQLVFEQGKCFQPHHAAAALLQLACVVTGQLQQQQEQPVTTGLDTDSVEYDQDWASPTLRSMDSMMYGSFSRPGQEQFAVAAAAVEPRTAVPGTSSSRSSGTWSAEDRYMTPGGGISNSSLYDSIGSSSNSRYTGLAGLIGLPVIDSTSVDSSTVDAPVGRADSSSSSNAGGFLSSATMAARMAQARQQQLEQQLLQQQQWIGGSWSVDSSSSSSASSSVSDASTADSDTEGNSKPDQQQQVAPQQRTIHYDNVLRRLLQLVDVHARHMSGSSGLTVLRALVVLQHQPDQHLLQRLLVHPLRAGLRKLRPAGLVNTAVRMAQLEVSPGTQWCRQYFHVMQQQLTLLSGQQLAAAAASLGQLGWTDWPDGWANMLSARLAPELSSMTARQLMQAAQSMTSCGATASESWSDAFLASTRQHLPSMNPQDLVQLLSALHSLEISPTDPWLRSYFTACPARGLLELSPSYWPQLLTALSGLKVRPDGSWLRDAYAACAPTLSQMDPQQIADTAVAAAALGMSPPEPWVAALAAASIWKLACCSPSQLAAIAEALVALKAHPGPTWLQQYAAATDAAMLWCTGEELARLVAAAAVLEHVPAAGWLQRVEAASHPQLGALSPAGLSSLARAMQQLAAQPSLSWVYAFVSAAYPQLDLFDGGQLTGLFDALPALAPGPGSADLLVQICCQELPARHQERLRIQQQHKQQQELEQQTRQQQWRQGNGQISSKRQVKAQDGQQQREQRRHKQQGSRRIRKGGVKHGDRVQQQQQNVAQKVVPVPA